MKHLAELIQEFPTSARDLAWLVLGKQIGNGACRKVFECLLDKDYVVKYDDGGNYQNIIEWKTWSTAKDTPIAKWFAPCEMISPNGHFLIQKKVEMIPKEQYPDMIPAFFVDTKYGNFGKLGKQFVCFDYGTTAFTKSLFSKAMRKANWWQE